MIHGVDALAPLSHRSKWWKSQEILNKRKKTMSHVTTLPEAFDLQLHDFMQHIAVT